MVAATMLVNYETSILDDIKEALASLFSEIKKLNPEKETEQKFEAELVRTLETYNQLSSVLGALFGIIDSKYKRIESELSRVKFGDPSYNSDDALSTYWETFNSLIETYIDQIDLTLDEIEHSEQRREILARLHAALLVLRNQFIDIFEKVEDLVEMIGIHDGLTEVRA
ncbi:hypothetical protein [uncultured Parasutterella sp.]|jgi:thiamine phosphate synthase YjbQ (UPF0047 family)|uniref:hypothetical protein n=1 Tax=uncultured Parasutterella sp. TaxID=1263098 RepID=UPI0025D59926|nr:hypothetical protein [uncultured Parasutterella sp.]